MKITIILLFISINSFAQFLSFSEDKIVKTLKNQNVKFIISSDYYGFDTITALNISGCKIQYIIDKTDVCHKEIITALPGTNIADLIMDLDKQNYIQLKNIFMHEEEYGVVEVTRKNNTFTFKYE